MKRVQKELSKLGFITHIHDGRLILSTEDGNANAYEYVGVDHIVGLTSQVRELANKAGYYWDGMYYGTYQLMEN